MLKNKKSELSAVMGLLLGWRTLLILIGIIAPWLIMYQPSFPYATELLPKYNLPQWLYSWANFDGVHYITIAEKGYIGTGLIQAFFPGYPYLMMVLNRLFDNTIVSGLLISNIALLLWGVVFFKFTAQQFSTNVAWLALITLLLFPTSFFHGAVYSESLFLLLVISTFYASGNQGWWLAGLLAAAAAATRVVGVFLVPALLWEALNVSSLISRVFKSNEQSFTQKLNKFWQLLSQQLRSHPKQVISSLLGLVGIGIYMLFLWGEFRDPLYFLHVQAEFGAGRQEHLILLPQTLWRGLKIMMTVPFSLTWLTYAQEFFLTISFLIIIGWLWMQEKRIKHSWLIFTTLAVLLPTTTGTLSSMPRYLLVAFPVFVWAGIQLDKFPRWRWIWIFSGILLLINTVLFIQGLWVA